jgi:hypothetical protein
MGEVEIADFLSHLANARQNKRATLEGDLIVHWETAAATGEPAVKSIDASHVIVKAREGEPAFQLVLNAEVPPFEGTQFVDPLILYDLDGDGLSEIVLAGRNLVFRRGWTWTSYQDPCVTVRADLQGYR